MEQWVSIQGFPGYQISSHGRVKSLRRLISKSNGAKVWFPEKMLKKSNRIGYYVVGLYGSGDHKTFCVHRLVATHFIPNHENKTCVNHKDLNKLNNQVDNLEWVTPKENTHHAIRNNSFASPPQGERNGQSKLTESAVRYIKSTRYKVSRKDLAKQFGVSIKHIDRVRCGERWGHIE